MSLPEDKIYLPRAGKFHWSDYITWNGGRGKDTYVKRFFLGQDNLNSKAIQFGSYVMELLEHNPEHELVADLPRHPYVEYDLECMLGGEIPIETHPDSIDIDNTLGIYEYKTALTHRSWNSRMVYKQQQISFYQMCVRELKGEFNPNDNYIVEIPTVRVAEEDIDGITWGSVEDGKYQKVWRQSEDDNIYTPAKLHQRVVTVAEIDRLRDDVIKAAREVSELYREYLEGQLKQII